MRHRRCRTGSQRNQQKQKKTPTGIHHMLQMLPQPQMRGLQKCSQKSRDAAGRHSARMTQNANDWSTLCGQAGRRDFVHFVRPAVRSWSSAVAVTGAGSNILRRHRCAWHCKCSIAMGREPKTLPHAGHLAMALCPWARLCGPVCHAFTLSCGHSGHNSASGGSSAGKVLETSTVLM